MFRKPAAPRIYAGHKCLPRYARMILLSVGALRAGAAPAWAQAPAFQADFSHFVSSADGTAGWMTSGAGGWRTLSNNHEAEFYSDASVGLNPFSTHAGVLTITAARNRNRSGLPFTSGLLTTYKLFRFRYGRVEVRARLPRGAGLWPAIWLLPADRSWPPEIDVMEMLGQAPGTIYQTLHSTMGGPNVATARKVELADTSLGFHTYSVDWRAETITWFVDGRQTFSTKTPLDAHQPMYLLINLAVGAPGSWPGAPDQSTAFPARMEVASVQIWR